MIGLAQRKKKTLEVQSLEDRRLLAVFGTAWPNPRDLTVSFPADGVSAGGQENQINALLDGTSSRIEWQELALRAYQTWSIHADINVGLRNDYNLDFGTPGLTTGDPRFGEFRIGAIPQTGLSASAVPYQAAAGTYSGDLFLNSNHNFQFHDWAGGQGPETSDPANRDIFSLFLHEIGNTLGIDDNELEWSVMFGQYTVPKGILSAEDIDAIQAIYGERTDPYETVDNGTVQFATDVPVPLGFDPSTGVLSTRGSLLNGSDDDFYKITPLEGQSSATLRLRASGISLLVGRLEVIDSSGTVVAEANADSVFDNDVSLQLSGLDQYDQLYVRVAASDSEDIYGIGDYELELDYRDDTAQASDPVAGAHDSGPDTLFANFGLVDSEAGLDNTIETATSAVPVSASAEDRYEFTASTSSASDVDYFSVTAPATVQGRLAIHLASVGNGSADYDVRVVDADGQPAGTAGRLHADGTFSIEVAQPVANEEYFIRVSVDPNSTVGVGNYVAIAEFEAPHSQMNPFVSGEVDADIDEYYRWTALKTRLFRFDLSVSGASSEQAVRLTVYDAHTKEVKLVAVAYSGITRGALAWLDQGDYILRLSALSTDQSPVLGADFSLAVDGVSDDQDDDNYDPDDENLPPYHYDAANDPIDPYDYDYDYGYNYG
ncbi:MAG: matrixin family metalloprotease [Planctomycetota bacterium]